MTPVRTRLAVAIAGILLTASALTGCAGDPPEIEQPVAASFQLAVFDVTTAAKAGDFETALAKLDSLQAELLTATAAKQVSGARSAQIQLAINEVSDDLAEQIEAARQAAEAQAAEDARLAEEAARAAEEAEKNNSGDDKGDKGDDDKGKDDDCKKGKDDC
jgi:hypothetical protein